MGMNKDLSAYIVKIILDKLSDMWVDISHVSDVYLPTTVHRFLFVPLAIEAILWRRRFFTEKNLKRRSEATN